MQYLTISYMAATVFCSSFLLCLAIISHTILRKRKFKNTAIKKVLTINILSIIIIMGCVIGYQFEEIQMYKHIIKQQNLDIDEYRTERNIYADNIYRLQNENEELKGVVKWQTERIADLEEDM